MLKNYFALGLEWRWGGRVGGAEREFLFLFTKIISKWNPVLPHACPPSTLSTGGRALPSIPQPLLSLPAPSSVCPSFVASPLHSPGSGNATSLPMRSTGKPATTTSCANAMPCSTATALPTTATSGSAEEPNERTRKPSFCSRASFCIPLQ